MVLFFLRVRINGKGDRFFNDTPAENNVNAFQGFVSIQFASTATLQIKRKPLLLGNIFSILRNHDSKMFVFEKVVFMSMPGI